eukprot:TRINITY_DN15554_c0_g1_i3.p1 TRINITY_DN15554_c0_g1~~TRINITY_DN15554_c0_g1_i3.p1  ORF type:complete len:359 (-),score=33.75 TRINITY_DN15554_c0_g1_i3:217-1293(-)
MMSNSAFTIVKLLLSGLALAVSLHVNLDKSKHMSVMSRNMYSGIGLVPISMAQTPAELQIAIQDALSMLLANNASARIKAIATEIVRTAPDFVALQEVTTYDFVNVPVLGTGQFDFLPELITALSCLGSRYVPVCASPSTDFPTLPTGVNSTFKLDFRNVVLMNADRCELKVDTSVSGKFDESIQRSFQSPLGFEVNFTRGWCLVDAALHHKRFRFGNTHLEIPEEKVLNEKQGEEFLSIVTDTELPIVLAGDFNSNADGSTTDTYSNFAEVFEDVWNATQTRSRKCSRNGYTCCQEKDLANPASELSKRIDFVFKQSSTNTTITSKSSRLVGDNVFQDALPRWASDHAGVVALFEVF